MRIRENFTLCPFDIMWTRLNDNSIFLILSLQIRSLEHTYPRILRPNAKFRTLFAKLVVAIALDAQADALVTVRTGQGDSVSIRVICSLYYCIID